ncbi:pyruvate kinase [Cerasicoccus arenae]|uniref:Pyruvate kinase n=1 Tax=Cerasicoccus arenae TaxID=424488 RepID=A0A8J3DH58_9BACT|nr:pyruvate kinase [Cerasicoccus arenae]MBK1859958.1 pyruvate kinase [Cerasicoccus arenae]GHC01484.1 pyruvate kinase [Cerasicoccus arenae]
MNISYRHTKIVFTLGPASESEERLEELIHARVDVCRLNMAHASHEWTRNSIRRVREVCERVNRHIAIMMDVKGPEIRTGDLPEKIMLEAGERFDFLVKGNIFDNLEEGIRGVTVNYPKFVDDVSPGGTLLVDSGLVRMKILEVLEDRVRCEVVIPGPMGNRRHINLPGTQISLPALTDKDRADIALGVEEGVDFFALSFVREAEDLDILRRHLASLGSQARIIAKIEDQTAISNLDSIVTASDAVMVARGDLGIECPYEQLPVIQRRIVKKCIEQKKPVIIATHMLESMIENPLPTRAEVSDIANAVFEKADAIMLSGETTTGNYPAECVEVMDRIARQIERELRNDPLMPEVQLKTPKAQMLKASTQLAQDLNAGIIVFSRKGYLAEVLSALRPGYSPIFCFTDEPLLFKQMLLLRGVEPFLMEFSDNTETTILNSFERLKNSRFRWAAPGDWMVVITNVIVGERSIDSVQMRQVH